MVGRVPHRGVSAICSNNLRSAETPSTAAAMSWPLASGPHRERFNCSAIGAGGRTLGCPRPGAHPLARKKALTLSDLDDVLVLLLEECHCFRDPELAACAKARARECAFRATSLATLAQMVSTGAGVTLLPTLSIPVENRRGQLEIRRFVAPAPARTIGLAWRPSVPFGDALRELAAGFERALSRNGQGGGAP